MICPNETPLFRINLNSDFWNKLFLGLFYCIISGSTALQAQTEITNSVYRKSIHSVRFHPVQQPFLAPIMKLGTWDPLRLSFDDLNDNNTDFTYRLIHCNANWQASNLATSEFVEGYDNAPLNDYDNSINTLTTFTHYYLDLPNDDMIITLSGNYIVEIYADGDTDNKVLTQRFQVYEQLVNIETKVQRPVDHDLKNKGQEFDFKITHPNFRIQEPLRNLKVLLQQNRRADNQVIGLQPTFIHENQLEYIYDKENVFLAGKEFRRLNIQNIKFKTMEVDAIYYEAPYMHFKLNRSFTRAYKKYEFEEDINGNYVVSIEGVDDSALEADYVWVHFSLEKSQPVTGGNVYVFGALSDWQCNPAYKMKYNYTKACYELSVLLKQGFYNYIFAFKDEDKNRIDTDLFEGGHFETENEYNIFVYYYDWDKDYDRLIGWKKTNSVLKL